MFIAIIYRLTGCAVNTFLTKVGAAATGAAGSLPRVQMSAWFQLLKPTRDELLSTVAFNCFELAPLHQGRADDGGTDVERGRN